MIHYFIILLPRPGGNFGKISEDGLAYPSHSDILTTSVAIKFSTPSWRRSNGSFWQMLRAI